MNIETLNQTRYLSGDYRYRSQPFGLIVTHTQIEQGIELFYCAFDAPQNHPLLEFFNWFEPNPSVIAYALPPHTHTPPIIMHDEHYQVLDLAIKGEGHFIGFDRSAQLLEFNNPAEIELPQTVWGGSWVTNSDSLIIARFAKRLPGLKSLPYTQPSLTSSKFPESFRKALQPHLK